MFFINCSRTLFQEAARKRFEELNSDSTIEESEELGFGSIFKVELGSVVRNVMYSFSEGGGNPMTRISTSSLISKKLPILRAVKAISQTL